MQVLRENAIRVRRRDVQPTTPATGPDQEQFLKVLYAGDRRREPRRTGDDLLHVSGVINANPCARLHYLAQSMREEGVSFDEVPYGNMRLVWAYGRAAERHVRETLLLNEKVKADAYGNWECRCKTTVVRGHYSPSAPSCTRCGTKPDRYAELAMHDDDRLLVGNADMYLKQGTHYTALEIKSIKAKTTPNAAGFDTISAPMPKHVEQASHYVHLGRRNGLPMHDKPVILYVLKDFDMRKWYKAFTPTDTLMAQVTADVQAGRAIAKTYAEARASNTVPAKCAACIANQDVFKKSCPVWAECVATR
jgi:hypothetical protein